MTKLINKLQPGGTTEGWMDPMLQAMYEKE
jgi:hypothetical protein